MQLMYESNRAIFDLARVNCNLSLLRYHNSYDRRSLATLQWLMRTLEPTFDIDEIAEHAHIHKMMNMVDDSIMQWLIINYTNLVIRVCTKGANERHRRITISILFEYFSEETIKLYYEKIDVRPIISSIGEEHMSKIKCLNSLIMTE